MRQLFREFVVGRNRAIEEQSRDLALAWYTAAFSRQKRLPDLKQLLRQLRPMQKQSLAEQRAVVEQLAVALRKPLKRVRLIRREPKNG